MTETAKLLEQHEEVLAYTVSDEALEAAAGADKEISGSYTLGSCTGVSVCPGW